MASHRNHSPCSESQPTQADSPNNALNAIALGAATGVLFWAMSLYHLLKFAGWIGAAAYLLLAVLGASGIVLLAIRNPDRKGRGISLTLMPILVSVALLAFVYPIANSQDPQKGSDRDDALNVGATALMRGEWPYHYKTYQGLPISPMPGSLVLAAPFVLLGSSAYQIPFWLALFGATTHRMTGGWTYAGTGLVLLIPVWASMVQEVATGGDFNLNAIYVLCPCLWLILSPSSRPATWVGLAVLCGVAFASRLNYLVTIPALFAAIAVATSYTRAALAGLIAASVFCMLTFPFYLYDPDNFGPLQMQDKFGEAAPWLAGKGWLMGVGSAALSVAGAVMIAKRRLAPISGFLLVFFIANIMPGVIASGVELLIERKVPLFIRWTSGSVPAMILLVLVALSRRSSNKMVDAPCACDS